MRYIYSLFNLFLGLIMVALIGAIIGTIVAIFWGSALEAFNLIMRLFGG